MPSGKETVVGYVLNDLVIRLVYLDESVVENAGDEGLPTEHSDHHLVALLPDVPEPLLNLGYQLLHRLTIVERTVPVILHERPLTDAHSLQGSLLGLLENVGRHYLLDMGVFHEGNHLLIRPVLRQHLGRMGGIGGLLTRGGIG